MPGPIFLNAWGCNPWADEPDRNAGHDQQQMGSYFSTIPAGTAPGLVEEPSYFSTIPPGVAPKLMAEPDDSYRYEDWFISLKQDWGSKAAVIPAEKYVSSADKSDVGKFITEVRKVPKDTIQCFDYADYQLYRAGFRTTSRPSVEPSNWQILVEHDVDGVRVQEVQVAPTIEAVMYMREAIQQGIPVLVGVCIHGYVNRPNNYKVTPFIEPQNHYAVVVAMGENDEGVYFDYYDYLDDGTNHPDWQRFYLKNNLRLESSGGGYVIAEVRRTLRR
jgi:hypothetical protein